MQTGLNRKCGPGSAVHRVSRSGIHEGTGAVMGKEYTDLSVCFRIQLNQGPKAGSDFMKIRHLLVLSALLASAATTAQAQFQKPEDAVKYRQSSLFVMGQHFSRLGAMANGRVPFNAEVAQQNAAMVLTMSKLPWPAFTPDTQPLESRAEPRLWAEMDKFKAASERYMGEAVKLDAAAKTGNLDAIKKAFGETAASCKACHDAYRQ
jgi:cytochrome c556